MYKLQLNNSLSYFQFPFSSFNTYCLKCNEYTLFTLSYSSFTEQDYTQLSNQYARDRTAQTFLSNYMYNDVAVITINPNSTMTWQISPPELARLEREAVSSKYSLPNRTISRRKTYLYAQLLLELL